MKLHNIIFFGLIVVLMGVLIVDARTITEKTNNMTILDNWSVNGDFENFVNDSLDWEVIKGGGTVNASVSWTTEDKYSGSYSMKVVTNGTGTAVIRETFPITTTPYWSISPNSTYILHVNYKGNVSQANAGLRLFFTDGINPELDYFVPVGNYTTWQTYDYTFDVLYYPPGATVTFGIKSFFNDNNTLYIDNLNLTVNRQEQNYTNGTINTRFKIDIPTNYNESVLHPMFVYFHGSSASCCQAGWVGTNGNTYVGLSLNDRINGTNNTHWWGNGSDSYTENASVQIINTIKTNSASSINSSHVYAYGSSMGGGQP